MQEKLEQSGEPQISTTDTDARALLVQGQVVEVSYNMQAAVDDKHNLIVATHTINRNDRNAMSNIAIEAKANLQAENFTALLDKGYHNGRESWSMAKSIAAIANALIIICISICAAKLSSKSDLLKDEVSVKDKQLNERQVPIEEQSSTIRELEKQLLEKAKTNTDTIKM